MRLSEGFYDELWTEIAGGGIEAFYHYLLHLDLSDFNPKSEPPGTVAKRDLAEEPYAKARIVPASKAEMCEKAEFTESK
uniref:Uncharacterized protein n=1 Tax=Candidatus Kentrum eta TaxID=2126337 RepID=A0A450V1Z4_9GAMM|nr:MAG: hypothetical protein BECKH772A_GA0070896_101479 [Candidatus Kentron sp. H]VFJ99047.1 MAG: hypothetical protein BECKH772B_GA0070898_101489 [Candidatus Kentron sp. H]VFK03795.1 MAG: hypothetical protein BECKH772C_GA0070978_101459 [Candidatus Kentron sp. H]